MNSATRVRVTSATPSGPAAPARAVSSLHSREAASGVALCVTTLGGPAARSREFPYFLAYRIHVTHERFRCSSDFASQSHLRSATRGLFLCCSSVASRALRRAARLGYSVRGLCADPRGQTRNCELTDRRVVSVTPLCNRDALSTELTGRFTHHPALPRPAASASRHSAHAADIYGLPSLDRMLGRGENCERRYETDNKRLEGFKPRQ